MDTLKSIFRVASSNFFNLGSSFILGFVLPIYISTFDYGKYKEYTLYLTFIYIFNLGFNDGIYIEYGGKNKSDIDYGKLKTEVVFLRIFQFIIFLIILAIALFTKDILLFFIAFASFFMNVIQFHKNFLQATGEFTLYSKLNIYNTMFNVVLMLAAIFALKSNNYPIYIAANVIALLLSYILYEYYFYKYYDKQRISKDSYHAKDFIPLFKVGIIILISNMMVTFVANLGSWVVNFLYSTEKFAQYSFSTSLLNILLLIVNAVSLVFYNLIAKGENEKMLIQLKKILLLLGIFGGLGYFAFSLIIRTYISKYIPALNILSITFISIPYIMESNVIFNNLYKTRNNKRMYLKDMLKFLAISVTLILVVTVLTDKMEYIAMATTLAYIIWYFVVTTFKFTYLKDRTKEIILMLSHIIVFWLSANALPFNQGLLVYCLYLLIVLVFYRNDLKEMIRSVK